MVLVLTISLSFPAGLAYSHYLVLGEVDFLASNFKFENPDQENLSLHDPKKWIILDGVSLPVVLLSKPVHFEQSLRFSFSPDSLDTKAAILRC
jgi:hypothetical protein